MNKHTPAKPIILCIDDDQDTCELLSFWLHNNGFEIMTARKCADAQELARLSRYDLIIIDRYLPDCDGLSLCKEMHDLHPFIPIIFETADARSSIRQEAFQAGANAFIEKPIDLELLVETIRRLLIDRPQAQSGDQTSPEVSI